MKTKLNWFALPPFLLELFMLTVVMLYLGEVGSSNFVIVAGDSILKILFNLSLFYMMALFFLNSTINSFYKFAKVNGEEK